MRYRYIASACPYLSPESTHGRAYLCYRAATVVPVSSVKLSVKHSHLHRQSISPTTDTTQGARKTKILLICKCCEKNLLHQLSYAMVDVSDDTQYKTEQEAPKKPLRSKKGKKRPRPPANEDFVKVVPLKIQDDPTLPLQISKARRGKHSKISPDNMSFSSAEGYRSVQSNRGTYYGTWFFEIAIDDLGSTGHCRLGVGTARQEIDAPCGYTDSSFGYRDVDGSKVHKAWREPYAKPYGEGDIIGVYLHLPEGGKPHETKTEVVRWRGRLFQTDDGPSEPAKPLVGSILGFSVNGVWQGAAFKDIPEGTYYAAASLFTAPKPETMATATFNFGPEFKFGPPTDQDIPSAKPFCAIQPPPAPMPDANGCITVDKAVAATVSEATV